MWYIFLMVDFYGKVQLTVDSAASELVVLTGGEGRLSKPWGASQ